MKFGRLPRAHDPRIPHFSSLLTERKLLTPPSSCDYTAALPWSLGMYGNDALGDCVVEDTSVCASNIQQGYRSKYSGPIIRLTLKSGKRLSITPNHAILTPRGFIRAKEIQKNDYLISTSRPEILVGAVATSGKSNINNPPSMIQDKVASLNLCRESVRKVMKRSIDFHGDEQFINGKIDVISTDSFLRSKSDTTLGEPHSKKQIRSASQLQSMFHRARSAIHRNFAGFAATFSDISFSGNRPAFAYGHFGEAQSNLLTHGTNLYRSLSNSFIHSSTRHAKFTGERLHCFPFRVSANGIGQINRVIMQGSGPLFGTRSNLYASATQPSLSSGPTDTNLFGNLRNAFSGLIEMDRVSHVDMNNFDGHVYDLSTDSKWYVADEIIAHNCTCAGVYHAAQIWSANTGAIDTEPDNDAVLLYESACGYVAGQPSTDQGGVEQEVLHHIYRHGFPTGDGSTRKFIHSYVEIDPRNIDDVAQGIYGSGLVYIGFNVPDYLPMSPGSTWDYTPGQKYSIQGGHCVVLPAYDLAARNFKAISWGSVYEMTMSFFTAFVDEAYALVDLGWFNATGLTPAGIPFATLEASMQALRS